MARADSCAARHPQVRCPARARPGARCRGARAIGSRWCPRANARLRTAAGSARSGQGQWSCWPPKAAARRRSQPSRTWGRTAQPHRPHRGAVHTGAVADGSTTSAAELGRSMGSQALVVLHADSEASACIGGQPWCVTLLTSAPASRARRMLEASAAAVLVTLGAVPPVFVAAGGRARWTAIQLAVIAVGTQHDLLATTHAQEQAG